MYVGAPAASSRKCGVTNSLTAVCVWAAAQSQGDAWAMLAGLVLLGALLYALARR